MSMTWISTSKMKRSSRMIGPSKARWSWASWHIRQMLFSRTAKPSRSTNKIKKCNKRMLTRTLMPTVLAQSAPLMIEICSCFLVESTHTISKHTSWSINFKSKEIRGKKRYLPNGKKNPSFSTSKTNSYAAANVLGKDLKVKWCKIWNLL